MCSFFRRFLALVPVLSVITDACSHPTSDSGVFVQDSAGITIVESHSPQWDEQSRWRLAQEPELTIGVEDGPEEYQLFRVRSAIRLDDGGFVIGNGGTSELRFYDTVGQFLYSRGGEGGGPGEFRNMGPIWRLADSLLVFDFSLRRGVVYSNSGALRGSFLIPPHDGAMVFPIGVFANGHLLARRSPLSGELGTGLQRDTSLFLSMTMAGTIADTVGYFPGWERYIGRSGTSTFSTPAPFGRESYTALFDNRFYFGASDVYQIDVRTSEGELKTLIRRPVPNPVITRAESEEFQRSRNERLPQMAPHRRELSAAITLPADKPAYSRLVVDREGNLWVSEYIPRRSALSPDEGTWTVFDLAGRMLGVVEMPAEGRILEIGEDYVLGVWRDRLDVERVLLYRLLKP